MSAIFNDSLAQSKATKNKDGLKVEISKQILKKSKLGNLSKDTAAVEVLILQGINLTLITRNEVIKTDLEIENSDDFYFVDKFEKLKFNNLMQGFEIHYKKSEFLNEIKAHLKCKNYYEQSYDDDFEIIKKDYFGFLQKRHRNSENVLILDFKENFDEVFKADATFRKICGCGFDKYMINFLKNEQGGYDLHFKNCQKNSDIECWVSDCLKFSFVRNLKDLDNFKLSHRVIHYLKFLQDKKITIKETGGVFFSDGTLMKCNF